MTFFFFFLLVDEVKDAKEKRKADLATPVGHVIADDVANEFLEGLVEGTADEVVLDLSISIVVIKSNLDGRPQSFSQLHSQRARNKKQVINEIEYDSNSE